MSNPLVKSVRASVVVVSVMMALTQSKMSLRFDRCFLRLTSSLLENLSLNDGSKGLSGECHRVISESLQLKPDAVKSVLMKPYQSSSSSIPIAGLVVSVYDSSSRERTRAIDPIGGDLSIRLDFRDIPSPVRCESTKVLQKLIQLLESLTPES